MYIIYICVARYESVILKWFLYFVYYIMFGCMWATVRRCVMMSKSMNWGIFFHIVFICILSTLHRHTNRFLIQRRMVHNWMINGITRFFDYQFPQMYSKFVWLKSKPFQVPSKLCKSFIVLPVLHTPTTFYAKTLSLGFEFGGRK